MPTLWGSCPKLCTWKPHGFFFANHICCLEVVPWVTSIAFHPLEALTLTKAKAAILLNVFLHCFRHWLTHCFEGHCFQEMTRWDLCIKAPSRWFVRALMNHQRVKSSLWHRVHKWPSLFVFFEIRPSLNQSFSNSFRSLSCASGRHSKYLFLKWFSTKCDTLFFSEFSLQLSLSGLSKMKSEGKH